MRLMISKSLNKHIESRPEIALDRTVVALVTQMCCNITRYSILPSKWTGIPEVERKKEKHIGASHLGLVRCSDASLRII
jgi:phage gp36-like protein